MKKNWKSKLSLRMFLVCFVFLILIATLFIATIIFATFITLKITQPIIEHSSYRPFLLILILSIILGTLLSATVSNHILKPLRKIIVGTQEVSAGNFDIQIETNSIPEIENLTQSFNKMVNELNSIETLRSDFISNFSHELKTPIVSIHGFAKLLKSNNTSEADRNEYIDIIIDESKRLSDLSTSVLNLSKLESVNIITDKIDYSLDEQIRRVSTLLEPRWAEKNISVELNMEEVIIHNNPDLLQQIWMNLIVDAIKYTQNNGMINISLKKKDGIAIFVIKDNGKGMNEQTLTHLFDKFYQGEKSHSEVGYGLGLTLVKRVVTLCDGLIFVESVENEGSMFTIKIPLDI